MAPARDMPGVQFTRMVVTSSPQPLWFLIFDDTFITAAQKRHREEELITSMATRLTADSTPGTMPGGMVLQMISGNVRGRDP